MLHTKCLRVFEFVKAYGHEKIRATHKSTFEITKDEFLTEGGDCIIGVKASKGAADLSPEFKKIAKSSKARIMIEIEAGGLIEKAYGFGSERLTFTHPTDLVVRTSEFTCGRTLAIKANKAAADLSREFVEKIKNPNQEIIIRLVAEITQ